MHSSFTVFSWIIAFQQTQTRWLTVLNLFFEPQLYKLHLLNAFVYFWFFELQEANNTLEAVDEVSDKLQRNIGIIRTRIQDHFDKLRSVMRKREIILLGAVDHVAFKKEKTLSNQRIEISVSI